MPIYELLGLQFHPVDTKTFREVTRQLEAMDPEEARFLAAFAFSLNRVARADSHISDVETQEMEQQVEYWGGLTPAQSVLVVQIAKSTSRLLGTAEDLQVSEQFKELALPVQCQELLHCMMAVSAADGSISGVEEALIRKIAVELGLSEPDFDEVRSNYRQKWLAGRSKPVGPSPRRRLRS